jgi:predicted nucleic acid-binding protein
MWMYVQVLKNAVTMVEADAAQALSAAEIKHGNKLGYPDSFAATLAVTRRATLVSADPAFEKVGKSLKWLRLPRFAK